MLTNPIEYNQGRMKRRGHATTIYQKTNGRGLISKNSKECIARAPFCACTVKIYGNLQRKYLF